MKSESIEDIRAEIFEAEMSEVRLELEEALEYIQDSIADDWYFELDVYYAYEFIPEIHDPRYYSD